MHGVSKIIRMVIAGILDLVLVFDACIGIVSRDGTVFDYLVLALNGFVLLLICAHWRARMKKANTPIPSEINQPNREK